MSAQLGEGGRGESNTPFPPQICNHDGRSVYKIAAVGVDQVRVVLSLSGDSARLCSTFTEHDYRPKGMPSMRMVGAWAQDGFKRTFRHFLGEDGPRLMYHRDSANLHVDVHFSHLAPVRAAVEEVETVVARLAALDIESLFPVRIARADFTGDVVFASPAYFRFVMSAFRSMLCDRGRVVEPYRSATLYINASRAARTKRLGRIYDKGAERAAAAGWSVPAERYLRIEAERLWEGDDRPVLQGLTPDLARETYRDRFGAVGRGAVLLKGGLVEPLMALKDAGEISVGQYEQLYAFLDHERMGLARELYPRSTYLRRARQARKLGLEIPGGGAAVESGVREIDVRALVNALAAAF